MLPGEHVGGGFGVEEARSLEPADEPTTDVPLESLEVVVNPIASTTTTKGLRVRAALDTDEYPTAIKVDDATMAALHLIPDYLHGDWNYAIVPGRPSQGRRQPRKLRGKL